MIKIVNEEIDSMIAYLNREYPTKKDCFIHICEGYDVIQTPDGKGFGVFEVPKTEDDVPCVYIAGDMPNDDFQIVETLAHEYKHFMQWCNKEEFSEKEAEEFAKEIKEKWKKMQKL